MHRAHVVHGRLLFLASLRASTMASTTIPRTAAAAQRPDAPTTDPRAICERYTDETYAKMRDDNERTAAYAAAIARAAPGRTCLDVGTGALALLALLAARAGARHVYAIEANSQAASAAREAVAAAGLAERVTVVEGYSTDVTLPEPVDLLLHEIFGEVAGAEGVVFAIADAARRHLAPIADNDGSRASARPLSVPARARSLLAPAEFPTADYFASLPHPMLAAPGATALKLPSLPRTLLLADAAPFETLEFTQAAPLAEHDAQLSFVAARDGELRGFVVHIELDMSDHGDGAAEGGGGEGRAEGSGGAAEGGSEGGGGAAESGVTPARDPDVSSARVGSHWPNVFLMLPEPTPVAAGDRIVVRAKARLASETPSYHFDVALLRESGATAETALGTLTYP
jgi:hypothetical protein